VRGLELIREYASFCLTSQHCCSLPNQYVFCRAEYTSYAVLNVLFLAYNNSYSISSGTLQKAALQKVLQIFQFVIDENGFSK
jgi:hypothetical protein